MKYSIVFNIFNTRHKEKYIDLLSKSAEVFTECSDTFSSDNKIFLGEADNALSKSARTVLDAALAGTPEGTVGFAIVKGVGSIAVVWSDFHLEEAAISHLAERLSEMEDGYTFAHVTPLMPYLEERGKRLVEEKWKVLEEKLDSEYAPEIISAMKDLYKILVDRKMVEWAANLYDAKVGGFYCSNSARDNEPYLPDIESTYVALSFISSSGMCEMFDGDWTQGVPEWLKDKVADFFIGLQDEDSFFYHPQWPKSFIIENNKQARITRDRNTAIRVLKKLGREPKYTEPERKASDDTPRMMTQFESVDNFRAYIKGLEEEVAAIKTPNERAAKFYFYGNLFQASARYLNENPEMKEIFIEFLEKYQNPENGMWADTVCYHGTNGLHKLADTANAIGYKLKHIDEMVNSVLEIINYDAESHPAAGAVYIYNAWSCFPYIYENILKYGDGTPEERMARKKAIEKRVLAAAPAALRACVGQMYAFKREEGGFSYGRGASDGINQGCPSSVPGVMEAGLGGNSIAVTALKLYIFKALELGEEYIPPVFTEYERIIYMDILERLNKNANQPTSGN